MAYIFTSDLHFGHANIIRYCDRPYADVRQMDEALISNWNDQVDDTDSVFVLGDLGMYRASRMAEIVAQLNGKKHWIRGNHDEHLVKKKYLLDFFEWVKDVAEIKIPFVTSEGQPTSQTVFLSHYAHRVWPKSHHGNWHFYGHSHGTLPDDPHALSMDVGVDAHSMQLVTFEMAQAHMLKKKFTPVDHHGATGRR